MKSKRTIVKPMNGMKVKRSETILIISIHNTRKHPRKKYRK